MKLNDTFLTCNCQSCLPQTQSSQHCEWAHEKFEKTGVNWVLLYQHMACWQENSEQALNFPKNLKINDGFVVNWDGCAKL